MADCRELSRLQYSGEKSWVVFIGKVDVICGWVNSRRQCWAQFRTFIPNYAGFGIEDLQRAEGIYV